MSSNLVKEIAAKAATLPLEQQHAALQYIESLAAQQQTSNEPPKRQSMLGAFAYMGLDVTSEDIDEVRREMWRNFPREDI